MYLITNRALSNHKNLKAFGKTPNTKGPNELRLVKVTKSGKSWKVEKVIDQLSPKTAKTLKSKYKLGIDLSATWHGSLEVACGLFEKARTENRSILFFVHGYNNDIEDVLRAAQEIERLYNVIVVPFSWPANGGGVISGTASYLSDKSDARASSGALNRVIEKIQYFHLLLTEAQKQHCFDTALAKHPNNPSATNTLFTRLVEKECTVKISLLCHSMGDYVFKHTFSTSHNSTSKLVFDNICLVAADTNNENHIQWVGQLDSKNRIYVVINENDSALKASRIKPGDEQKARLGHYTRKLNSPNAHYLDVTGEDHIGSEHTYFKGDPVEKNQELQEIFNRMFKGQEAESLLQYHPDNNTYKF